MKCVCPLRYVYTKNKVDALDLKNSYHSLRLNQAGQNVARIRRHDHVTQKELLAYTVSLIKGCKRMNTALNYVCERYTSHTKSAWTCICTVAPCPVCLLVSREVIVTSA